MGTTPSNYPPVASMILGEMIASSSIGNTATLAQTIFFTAPNPGVYLISAAVRIVTTNAAGTLTATVVTPHAGTIAATANAAPATPTDGYLTATPVWMNAGDTITAGVVAAGLTGTTYNVLMSAQRIF